MTPGTSETILGFVPTGQLQRGERVAQLAEAGRWQGGSVEQPHELEGRDVTTSGSPRGVAEHQVVVGQVAPDCQHLLGLAVAARLERV